MTDAGYTNSPLVKKLGIKSSHKIMLINKPKNYHQLLGTRLNSQLVTDKKIPDFIHLFSESKADYKKDMRRILKLCKKNTSMIVWVS